MISIKNLTLLIAVLLMGLCLVSSVSAMDIDDSVSDDLSAASVSSDLDVASASSISNEGDIASVSSDSNEENLASASSDSELASDSNSNALEAQDAGISNVNSKNEVLSTDNSVEDSDLKYNSKSKSVLSASSQDNLQASKVKTSLKGSSSTIYRGKNYVLTLTDSNGKVLSGEKLSYTIGGSKYTLTTDSKGSTYLQINLKAGKYTMLCAYAGSDKYAASSFSVTLTVKNKPNYFSIADIENAASRVKNYVSKNKKLPKTVKVGSKTLKISEFSYLAAKAIANLNSNKNGKVALLSGISNGKSSTATMKATIYKAQFVSAAKSVVSKTKSKKVPPAYITVKNRSNKAAGKASFNLYTFAFAKILDFHKSNKYLPNYCSFNSAAFKKSSAKKATILKGSSNTIYRGKNYVLTLTNKNGKALKGQKLSYKVNGKTYTLTTDSNGHTYLQINLKAGKYTMVCSYAGSKTYKSAKKTVLLTVKNNPNTFTLSQIEAAATNVEKYVNTNKKLPNTVKVGSKTLKISEFSYLASKAISNLGSNNKNSITLISGISDGSSSTNSIKSTVNKAQYVDLAKRSSSNINSKKVPASSLAVKDNSNKEVSANFNLYTFAFAKILDFYKGENYLPNYCTFDSSAFGSAQTSKPTLSSSGSVTVGEIETAAANVKNYVSSNKKLPTTVTVGTKKLSISQFSYLMAKTVCNINDGNLKSVAVPNAMSDCNSAGDNLKTTVYKAEYVDVAKRVVTFDESNKVSPVYAMVYSSSGASVGKSEFKLYTFAFSKILAFHKTEKYLPNYCTFESSAFQGSSAVPANIQTNIKYNSSQFKNGLNEKNTETDLSKYLVGTGRSAITTSIKTLANKLTKGLTSTEAKAQAIYKYVRDDIDYSYYADSRYGAAGTLSAGSGNCVDQASLVVALCRASGIHARYAHAQGCTFSSGLVTGHVWAQILVNGVWYSADATSVRNSLGNVVNWNTNSYYSLKKYTAVPF